MHKKISILLIAACIAISGCARIFPKGPDRFYFGAYSEAEAAYNHGDYQAAIDNYSAYIAENPDGNLAVIAKYYMAPSYANLGQTDKARSYYTEVIQKNPDLVWAKFSEAQLLELNSSNLSLSN